MEELIAWIVVPLSAVMGWWVWLQVKDQIRGTPLMSILTGRDRGAVDP